MAKTKTAPKSNSADNLSKEDANELKTLAKKIGEAHSKEREQAFLIGKYLTEAQGIYERSDHSAGFKPWLEKEAKIIRSSAYNYMAVYRTFAENPECATVEHSFDWTAMIKLANRPDTKDKTLDRNRGKARNEAVRLAKKGERIDAKKAHKLLVKHKAVKSAPDPKADAKPDAKADAGATPKGEYPCKCQTVKNSKIRVTIETVSGLEPDFEIWVELERLCEDQRKRMGEHLQAMLLERLSDSAPIESEKATA